MYPSYSYTDAPQFSSSFLLRSVVRLFLLAACTSPAGLSAQVPLVWNDNSTNKSGFKLERATGSGSYTQIAVTGSNVQSYVDPAATANTTYRYRVRAFNSSGHSSYSNIATISVPNANTAPSISAIADRAVSENGTTGAISFTVADAETSAASLQLTATSSNTTLVPAVNITFGGSGGSRTITVKPAANQSGTAIITAKISDGSLSATHAFTVTVNGGNDAPTISNVLDRSCTMGSLPGVVAITVGDIDTPAASLVVTATSSNQTLLPNAGMLLGGTGTSRTLTLTPLLGLLGSTTVSVKVSDGTLSVTDTFVLSIVASSSNATPTVSAIADRSIAMNGTTGAIAFTISDSTTPAAQLTLTRTSSNLTLVPLSAITLGGSGAYRTVTVKPTSNIAGTATISIKVSDGTLSRTETFDVNVTSTSNLSYIDIGSPALAGSQVVSGSTIRVTAGGAAPAATADQFRFAYLSLPGDAELLVRVASLPRVHDWTRAGLMFRASTAANAAHASVYITSNNGVVLQSRSATGASYKNAPTRPGTAPQWLRLTRTGDTFYAFTSEDGSAWDLVEFVTVDLPWTALGGLAATSQHATTSTTAMFDNFIVD